MVSGRHASPATDFVSREVARSSVNYALKELNTSSPGRSHPYRCSMRPWRNKSRGSRKPGTARILRQGPDLRNKQSTLHIYWGGREAVCARLCGARSFFFLPSARPVRPRASHSHSFSRFVTRQRISSRERRRSSEENPLRSARPRRTELYRYNASQNCSMTGISRFMEDYEKWKIASLNVRIRVLSAPAAAVSPPDYTHTP